MKICFVTVSFPAIEELTKVGEFIATEYGKVLDLKIYLAAGKMERETRNKMEKDIESADLSFIDLMGSHPDTVASVYIGLENTMGHVVPYGGSAREYLRLGKFSLDKMGSKKAGGNEAVDMSKMKKMSDMSEKIGKIVPGKMRDMRNYSLIMKYFKVSDYKNILNMIYLILNEYGEGDMPSPEEPDELEGVRLCDPNTMRFYRDYEEYLSLNPLDPSKANVGIIFYGHNYPTDTSKPISDIKDRLGKEFNVIPIGVSNTFQDEDKELRKIILEDCPIELDLLINFMSFRLTQGPMGGDYSQALDLLEELDVAYFHPFLMTRKTEVEWMESSQGASSSELMISVMLPELDGAIEIFPVASKEEVAFNEDYQVSINQLEIIEERVDALVEKALNYTDLRRLKNQDKKIAIICYNYPPGESNLFGGAFLDSFESVEKILWKLKESGYNTSGLSSEELRQSFNLGGLVNSGRYGDYSDQLIRYPVDKYRNWIIGEDFYEELIENIGHPPGEIMGENENFLIPGLVDGNIFIGLQPARTSDDDSQSYHSKDLYPHHQYLAYYRYLKEDFKADAIIHVGTHGTLEFQRGKECGMSGSCIPDILIGNLPHFYFYYVGNPSEATIAKRRSYANIISYQPPVFIPGELYGDYSRLQTLIDNYKQSIGLNQYGSQEILDEIYQIASQLEMDQDLDLIEAELYRMKTSLIPKGLHILGQAYTEEEARIYAKGVLRHNLYGGKSLRSLVAKALGEDIEKLEASGESLSLRKFDSLADKIFDQYFETGEVRELDLTQKLRAEIEEVLERAREFKDNSKSTNELEALIKLLDGRYNIPKMAGDLYRNPDILPTGFNLYQFDPRLVPTGSAYRRGAKIAEETLRAYREEEGKYPEKTAVILWGIESSRTQGESFSQILSYLGIRVINTGENWSPKYEIIPIEELGRPRIDVSINICGFFRDMFPNLIENLSDVLYELADLDESEEENYFKKNTRKIYQYLLEEGYEEKEARELSRTRIFGPESGQYGTGLTDIIESKNWNEEEELGTLFLENLQYAYNRESHGEKIEGLYRNNLKNVDIVSQIRSSVEYEITDLDHYYEFFGGLSKSVELTNGKKAKMYITDVTRDKIESESIEKSINRGVRTRVLNPKWIDGLLKHKRHGGSEISDRFENIMGLAATTGSVEDWIYEDLNKKYVEDEEIRKRLIENNKFAYMDILERMMEYYKRGYWKAKEEDIRQIQEIYLDLENSVEKEI